MAKTAVKSPGARRGRPALKLGSPKRSSFNTRLRTEIKQQLETEAQIAGRSLSEEIEFRLERSLQQEADSGGRQLHGLLRLLGGAAEIIQERRGKSPFDDWDTWDALQKAWDQLIEQMAPEPPLDIIRLKNKTDALQSKLPAAPELPPLPDIPNALLAGKLRHEAYEKEFREFQMCLAEHQREFDELRQETQKLLARATENANLGRDAATDVATKLFPSSLNRE